MEKSVEYSARASLVAVGMHFEPMGVWSVRTILAVQAKQWADQVLRHVGEDMR